MIPSENFYDHTVLGLEHYEMPSLGYDGYEEHWRASRVIFVCGWLHATLSPAHFKLIRHLYDHKGALTVVVDPAIRPSARIMVGLAAKKAWEQVNEYMVLMSMGGDDDAVEI